MTNILSACMRAGAKKSHPSIGKLFDAASPDGLTSTLPYACALAAAYLGTVPVATTIVDDMVARAFPQVTSETRVNPVGHEVRRVADIIIHLNDTEGWTRERIADWLESEGL